MSQRERRTNTTEHGENTDAETQQGGDAGGEHDHQQDQRKGQRNNLGPTQVACKIRVEVVSERDVTGGGDAERAGVHLTSDRSVLRPCLREVDLHPHLHEDTALVGGAP